MLPQYIALISVITTSIAGFFYIKGMLYGSTKPNRASWLIWAVAPITASFIQFFTGAGLAALPIFMAGLVPLFVLITSYLKKGAYWELTWLDYICLLLSAIALVLWLVFREGVLATLFAILADGIAFVPTFKKSWQYPESENAMPYVSGIFNASLSLLVVSPVIFTTAGFAVYLATGNFLELLILLVRRKKQALCKIT
jgi:hypothetical protein